MRLTLRAVVPLVIVGLILLLVSVVLVARDVAFARSEAESEVLGFAETSAVAIQFTPAAEMEVYLTGILKHPAISMATVYSANGPRTTRRRPQQSESSFSTRLVPRFKEPIVACRAVGETTLCLEGDSGHYQKRLAALIVPHAILLGASAILLVVAIALARGGNRQQISELNRILRGAAEENNYSLRAPAAKGEMGELSGSINGLLEQMHQRDLMLRRRTTELENVNKEVEAFSYSVSHDLRGPLASIDGFSEALREYCGDQLDESGKEYVNWIREAVTQMTNLITGLMQMSRVTRADMTRTRVDLSEIAQSIAQSLRQRAPSRTVDFRIEPELIVEGDPRLLHAVLENLMSNAFKFTSKKDDATITVGKTIEGDRRAYFVRDNGAGFDSTQAARMFTAFQRLHASTDFEGTGIGLATVKRIIERHGGAIWADGEVGKGATFFFTLGETTATAAQPARNELTRV